MQIIFNVKISQSMVYVIRLAHAIIPTYTHIHMCTYMWYTLFENNTIVKNALHTFSCSAAFKLLHEADMK